MCHEWMEVTHTHTPHTHFQDFPVAHMICFSFSSSFEHTYLTVSPVSLWVQEPLSGLWEITVIETQLVKVSPVSLACMGSTVEHGCSDLLLHREHV